MHGFNDLAVIASRRMHGFIDLAVIARVCVCVHVYVRVCIDAHVCACVVVGGEARCKHEVL